ncbi:hypothetical protein HK107_01890 [Parvularcula sp. ZS-1/3]|uniref:Uncharacterized protein n=1 Tax=Parvularcula mediterranea TaxID=2732508 RepID=A0A7Y3RJ72_9PROT|nr:hypothetical protein [Parvularcula mediterranea]NNU15074.1 hypothetical protein [Parvularcula mediterranea]
MSDTGQPTERQRVRDTLRTWIKQVFTRRGVLNSDWVVSLSVIIGLVLILAMGIAWVNFGLSGMALILMTFGAFLFIGGLLGFLFGIPRTVTGQTAGQLEQTPSSAPFPNSQQGDETRQLAQEGASKLSDDQVKELRDERRRLQVRREAIASNTNLEQISDWLTKIIIGASLVQLRPIATSLGGLSRSLGASLESMGQEQPHALHIEFGGLGMSSTVGSEALNGAGERLGPYMLMVILFSSVIGFLFAYLWTRIFLFELLIKSAEKNLQLERRSEG